MDSRSIIGVDFRMHFLLFLIAICHFSISDTCCIDWLLDMNVYGIV